MFMLVIQPRNLRLYSEHGGSSRILRAVTSAELSPEAAAVLSGESTVPVFIIVRDRLVMLNRSIEALRKRVDARLDIIIVDTGTTYKPTLRYQDDLVASGLASVVRINTDAIVSEIESRKHSDVPGAGSSSSRLERIRDGVLNQLSDVISNYLREHPDSHYYCVTDPDVELDAATPGNVFAVWAHILDNANRNEVSVVGPSLRIDDLPMHLDRSQAVRLHEKAYWATRPLSILFSSAMRGGRRKQPLAPFRVYFSNAGIDTTMGLYLRSFKWRRLNDGVRTLAPYWARHLPWYSHSTELSADERHYAKYSTTIGYWTHKKHWGQRKQ